MKSLTALTTSLVAAAAISHGRDGQVPLGSTVESDKYLIELGVGETRWISENEKWELKRVRSRHD